MGSATAQEIMEKPGSFVWKPGSRYDLHKFEGTICLPYVIDTDEGYRLIDLGYSVSVSYDYINGYFTVISLP